MTSLFSKLRPCLILGAAFVTSLSALADPHRRITEYTYDERGRLAGERFRLESDAEGLYRSRTEYAYDVLSNRISVTSYSRTDVSEGSFSASPLIVRSYYTNSQFPRLLTKEVDADGFAVAYKYNTSGQPIEVIGPFFDATPGVHTDDPVCAAAGIACTKYDYQLVAGISMVSEIRTKITGTSCRLQTVGYFGPEKKYGVQSVTSETACVF